MISIKKTFKIATTIFSKWNFKDYALENDDKFK
jgi:hypothetical protein